MKLTPYYLSALAAFSIWGFFSLVLKPLHMYPSIDILFYRVFLCAALMMVISLFFRRKTGRAASEAFSRMDSREQWRTILLTLGGGLFLTGNWFFFIFVVNHVSVKAASFAYLLCPILTTVLAFFLLQEKLCIWQWAAVLLSLASCVLLSFNNFADLLCSLIIAVSYALYLVSQRRNNGMDRFLSLTFQVVFSALLLLPFYPRYSAPLPASGTFYMYIAVIAVLFTIVPLFLNLYALKGLSSSTVGILLYINPVINFIMAIWYYHERINGLQITAYSIILVSIILFNKQYILRRPSI